MSKEERQKDLLKIIESVDISPTMYNNAVEKYEKLANYLESHGLRAQIYPQGSFALGTVTRPYSKSEEKEYDLDFICQVEAIKGEIGPKELRDKVQRVLESSDLYGGKLSINDECFTIEYADIGTYGFSIDIVPAVDETPDKKGDLMKSSSNPELISTAIAIPRFSQQKVYNWITNNPKGYRNWFFDINRPFEFFSSRTYRETLFENNKEVFRSVEEIPQELNRSSMQRVVQILKYHRDVYYSNVPDGENVKPVSAIINTIVAQICSKANPNYSPIDLLKYVLEELKIYSMQVSLREDIFRQRYGEKAVIQMRNGRWIIENPANPGDNLANKWNDDSKIPHFFFKWLAAAKVQLIDALDLSDEEFRASAEAAFGKRVIQSSWGSKYNPVSPKPISTVTKAKPWRRK